ncbi:hypothetical protein ACVJ19_002408 [Bradyrhizobium sp. USDA 376]
MLQRIHVDADRLVSNAVALDGGLVGHRLLRRGLFLGGLGRFLRSWRRRFSNGRGLGFGNRYGDRRFDRGLAEGALELVERDFAGTQGALQRLIDQRARGHLFCGCSGNWCFRHQRRRLSNGSRAACGHRRHALLDHRLQLVDEIAVVAFGLGFGCL